MQCEFLVHLYISCVGIEYLSSDLKVWFQDPTGMINASIHHKVLSEGEFAKDLSVGAVLVLQKVWFHSFNWKYFGL